MTCSVEGCRKAEFCRGWCPMHYQRWRKHGDLSMVKAGGSGWNRGTKRNSVCYETAHYWVRTSRGKAHEHICVQCGAQAAHWAYDHEDMEESPSQYGPYSLKDEHYNPMCAKCHKTFDMNRG